MKKIKLFLIMVASCFVFVHCADSDEYKKYIEGGEIVYPQKAGFVKTYPGKNRIKLKWVITDPRVAYCDVYYEQSGIKDSLIVDLSSPDYYKEDTVLILISNLEETTYTFRIVSRDDMGNKSITVEEEGSVYGEIYERGLVNRVIKELTPLPEGLKVIWYSPDTTEIAVKVNYIDLNGQQEELIMNHSDTILMLPDCDVKVPFTYQTIYKPLPEAFDIFYTTVAEGKYAPPVYPSELINAQAPFQLTDEGLWFFGRWGTAKGWIANDAAGNNGIVDSSYDYSLVMWAWPDLSPAIKNGKIYQRLSLEAGNYSFEATIRNSNAPKKAYVVVAKETDLPDIDQIENQSLSYQEVVGGMAQGTVLKCKFYLQDFTTVSVGIAGDLNQGQETVYSKFELKKE
ncbi:MAG: DUF5013 domain-containing protein [Dysgonamonadaceae bacterium]|jgi:hypothetical protein|nr:DUF5013 domain-containing protein [Dysgonamonadaceae bacterium]